MVQHINRVISSEDWRELTDPLAPIARDRVSQLIFDDLKSRIIGGDFVADSRLPSEGSLATSYGVSRSSVRAALQRLQTLGLIEIRVGEGSYVRERSFSNLLAEVSALMAEDSLIPYVRELRETIEIAAARLALSRASDEELAAFVGLAEELGDIARSSGDAEYLEADYNFHLRLCSLSHNRLFEFVYAGIRDLFRLDIVRNLETTRAAVGSNEPSAERHLALAVALAARDEAETMRLVGDIVNLRPSDVSSSATRKRRRP